MNRLQPLYLIVLLVISCQAQASNGPISNGEHTGNKIAYSQTYKRDLNQLNELAYLINRQLSEHRSIDTSDGIDPEKSSPQLRQQQVSAHIRAIKKEVSTPDLTAIRNFYDANPSLFSNRKVFRLQEIAIRTDGNQAQKIRSHYSNIHSLNEMKTWLDKQGVTHHIGLELKASEQIPTDLLPTLSSAIEGQTFIVNIAEGISILQLTGIESQPRSFDDSIADINSFLEQEKYRSLIQLEIDRLKSVLKI